MHDLKKITQENSDMYSMRCDTMYKMDLANEFKDDVFESIEETDDIDHLLSLFIGLPWPCLPNSSPSEPSWK